MDFVILDVKMCQMSHYLLEKKKGKKTSLRVDWGEEFMQMSVNPANFQNFQNIFGCKANTCGVSQECNEASRTPITATWKCSLIFRDVSAVSVGFICA